MRRSVDVNKACFARIGVLKTAGDAICFIMNGVRPLAATCSALTNLQDFGTSALNTVPTKPTVLAHIRLIIIPM